MTDATRTDELGSLFESITGETSVVESQRPNAGGREIDGVSVDRSVDGAIGYHGLADAIGEPEPVDDVV